jgi:hypothetical protein
LFTVINIQDPYRAENFLTSYEIIRFVLSILLREVTNNVIALQISHKTMSRNSWPCGYIIFTVWKKYFQYRLYV